MAKPLRSLIRRTLLARERNLVSLDDPYEVIRGLLRDRKVSNIVDAGASVGRVARRLARPFPDANVHLFEPNPHYDADLKALADADPRFHPWPIALADAEGEIVLHFTASRGQTSRYRPNERAARTWGEGSEVQTSKPVPVVTIDNWADRENIGPIELFKLDIQAGEVLALRGSDRTLREQILVVYTEAFFNPMYDGGALFGEIDVLLRERGFLLYDIYKPKADARGMLLHANPIYVHAERMGF